MARPAKRKAVKEVIDLTRSSDDEGTLKRKSPPPKRQRMSESVVPMRPKEVIEIPASPTTPNTPVVSKKSNKGVAALSTVSDASRRAVQEAIWPTTTTTTSNTTRLPTQDRRALEGHQTTNLIAGLTATGALRPVDNLNPQQISSPPTREVLITPSDETITTNKTPSATSIFITQVAQASTPLSAQDDVQLEQVQAVNPIAEPPITPVNTTQVVTRPVSVEQRVRSTSSPPYYMASLHNQVTLRETRCKRITEPAAVNNSITNTASHYVQHDLTNSTTLDAPEEATWAQSAELTADDHPSVGVDAALLCHGTTLAGSTDKMPYEPFNNTPTLPTNESMVLDTQPSIEVGNVTLVQKAVPTQTSEEPTDEPSNNTSVLPTNDPMALDRDHPLDLTTEPNPTPVTPTRPSQRAESSTPSNQETNLTNNNVSTLPPTPPPTQPQKIADPPLFSYPEVADRYVPITSTADGFDMRNPQTFCLKPGFWRKWRPSWYADLATDIRLKYDPTEFARTHGVSVEEVTQVSFAVVATPLYDVREAARRGEEGMKEIFKFHRMAGTQPRLWREGTQGKKAISGELQAVQKGIVKMILENGSVRGLGLGELGEGDWKYLKKTLTKGEMKVLLGKTREDDG